MLSLQNGKSALKRHHLESIFPKHIKQPNAHFSGLLKTLDFLVPYATVSTEREFPAVPCQPTDQRHCAAFHFA